MKRKTSGAFFLLLAFAVAFNPGNATAQKSKAAKAQGVALAGGFSDRQVWTDLLYKIVYPVVHNLANGSLQQNMPLETGAGYHLDVRKVTYLEAVGRTLAGIAPWLTLPDDSTREGLQRKTLRQECLAGLKNMVTPNHPDFISFATESQPIVDAAFLAHAFLRAPQQLWAPLDTLTKTRFIAAFQSLRNRKAGYNNWLLFAGITEAFLLKIGADYDPARIDFSLKKMKEWYIGDGWYMDGEHFAMDYYNSFVIQPMLVDILAVMVQKDLAKPEQYTEALQRMVRFSDFQERIISPEGTYPPFGRSITYRSGAFQVLNQVALMHSLPEHISPAQVRCALTKVYQNQFEAAGTFDQNGWLKLGFVGSQPMIADTYTSTGSLYLCSVGFLALGLPPEDAFWSAPPASWTAQKAWNGLPFKKDYKVAY